MPRYPLQCYYHGSSACYGKATGRYGNFYNHHHLQRHGKLAIYRSNFTFMQRCPHIYSHFAITGGLIFAAALLPPNAWAQIGLAMAPMRVETRMTPGSRFSGSLALSNDSPSPIRVRAETLDFFIDPVGTPQFARDFPNETPLSCRSWLGLNPMEMELEAGKQVMVRYTISAPPGTADGGYHCAAGFTTLPAGPEVARSGLRTAVRVISAFYPVIGNPPILGLIKEIKLEQLTGPGQSGWSAVVVLENSGHMYFRPNGELAVLDKDGKTVEVTKFQPLPVLPMRDQRFQFPIKAQLERSQYTLRARVDVGLNEIQEAKVVVVPQIP